MLILISCRLAATDQAPARAAFEDMVQWGSINTLYWCDDDGLYLFESNYSAQEIRDEITREPALKDRIERLVVFEIPRFKDIASFGVPTDRILRSFLDA
ncbi:hypothetical protein [Nitratireductor sp. ZSWI3]|uniref:hypothetical protein n=1 Tax=Nitratireductor sp. ZSWI3 TaxID=2966359 RepID=UPI0021505F36|nr:hypothetical protein [Nitratireductor sp. ZSWI3]MCR4265856.1 hypothetical protein [Nitratireductor sp. ZSWI3]